MQRVFIFAEQVQKIIAEGKKEIEIPEGARVSSAAADLIKDHKLIVKHTAPQSSTATRDSKTEDNPLAKQPVSPQDTSAKTASVERPADAGADISDEELEALVNRVVERFKQFKGIETIPAGQNREAVAESQQAQADDDDLVICRCEEITKGEIKA
ncbi:MAG: hypothetical protein R3274_12655, partial [Desulfobacterales bacterium]|nr:hypothetical protein [Desulfobacterales bacterium]